MVREAGVLKDGLDPKKFPHSMFLLKLFEIRIYLFKKIRRNIMLFNSCSYNNHDCFASKNSFLDAKYIIGGMES